jgi:Fructose-bisphosphate aldolase class-II
MHVNKPRLFFDYALRNRFAVPSFNVCNLEIAGGVILAAEAENAPVMLQTSFGDLYYAPNQTQPLTLKPIPKLGPLSSMGRRFLQRKEPDCPAIILLRYSDCETSGFPRTRRSPEFRSLN